ncbi:hypothetical protein SY83_17850 [Paenibacillus swuensis]|uniref:FHA domain-containing protein n=1 Tax=Paenibacillus swuensis TaxID=1178515 RepID=A0A172TM11_9BACL|nr:DUF6382 domain-containing protein [Paenibacillus swuensis]ANE47847.1 hypothetical protein SY83_17850 [Paenibacillus swuensis]
MNKAVHGIRYDYERSDTLYLVVLPVGTEEVDPIAFKMILKHAIPTLIPFSTETWNSQTKWLYRIGSEKPLSSILKIKERTQEEKIRFFIKLIGQLEAHASYLLSTDQYVLDDELIYTNENLEYTKFVCLPLISNTLHTTTHNQIKLLFEKYLGDVVRDNKDMQSLMNHLTNSEFKLSEVRERLAMVLQQQPSELTTDQYRPFLPETELTTEAEQQPLSSLQLKIRFSFILALLSLLLWVGIQRIFGSNMAYIGTGILLLSVAGWLWKTVNEPEPETGITSLIHEDTTDLPMEQYYADLHMKTALLPKPDQTVLLTMLENPPESQTRKPAVLVIGKGTEKIQIPLEQESFIIGRAQEEADYVEQAMGTSRLHLEITYGEQQYEVRDLASVNGSKLNGEALVPNKKYLLKDGDRIRLPGAQYLFKMEF